jgi:tRNA-specific 2-thiouridylase
MSKPEARAVARQSQLAIAEKEESQEICFVPDGDYAAFIDRYLEAENIGERTPAQGELVDAQGHIVGTHTGIHRYTVGQRRGIGISAERPLYVLSIDAAKNQVTVGSADELLSHEFTAAGVNWISPENAAAPVSAAVRVRYRHEAAPATIAMLANGRARVTFAEPQRAITPGQATVFYRDEEVLGGGWIVK